MAVNDSSPGRTLPPLRPLPYHDAVVAYLQSEEPHVWRWAASAKAKGEHAQEVRTALLKETYRLDPAAHEQPYQCARAAAARLGIDVPVTLYQLGDGPMNAALYYLPNEVHVVLSGSVLERLNGAELQALLGHELAHYHLWQLDDGAYHCADRILTSTASDPRASASHVQTARLYRLFTEVFADRGACLACGALEPAVSTLVKSLSGLTSVSAESYLRQADEVCAPAAQHKGSAGVSHPESFVRARALRLWSEGDAAVDDWLGSALAGPLSLGTVDLLGQQRLVELTRALITAYLALKPLRAPAVLAHARQFFPDIDAAAQAVPTSVSEQSGVHDYLSYVLMDLACADREILEVALAGASDLAQRWGFDEAFARLAQKDLGLPKRRYQKMLKDGAATLAAHGSTP